MINVALFVSGFGSNAYHLLEKREQFSQLKFKVIITDNPKAKAIDHLAHFNVPIIVIPFEGTKKVHETKILKTVNEYAVHWCLLAGYMRLLTSYFLDHFKHGEIYRVMNIHPSLLPRHPGLYAYEKSFADKYPDAGVTVHLVDQGIDSGPVIVQKSFEKKDLDFNKFHQEGRQLEYSAYQEALKLLDRYGDHIHECLNC